MPDSSASQRTDGPGTVTHLIQVQNDPVTHTLTVSRSPVAVNPGDTVVWSFLGIPEGWTPWIEFRRTDDKTFVGPLQGLTQAPGGIWGVCRTEGWTAATNQIRFEYRAMIQKGFAAGWDTDGSVFWSAPALLDVQPQPVGKEVTFTVTKPDGSNQLDVQPPLLPLGPGDVIVWKFDLDLPGGPEAWRPRIKFHRYEGSGTVPNQHLGPCAAMSVYPGAVRGTGNSGVDGLYFFEVALVSVATGEIGWVSSGDPVVDNRGGVIVSDGGSPP